ncbi:MAG TPA: sortase [Nevskiaceae bacterium]|nr:sortase [Nevskiaceae bacterium]
MKEAIIYRASYPKVGEVFVARKEPKFKLNSRLLAGLLVYFGITATLLFLSPFVLMEAKYRLSRFINPQKKALPIHQSELAEVIYLTNLKMLKPINPQFSLIIPKIGLNSEVIANVPAGDENQYKQDLKQGVAHAAGSFLPGENGSIYLFGHSTDYIWNISRFNAVFYLLKELSSGDQVNVFYKNQRYVYKVVEKKITNPGDLSLLKPQTGEEKLVLQTCWPLGTNWKRMVVIANKV